MSKVAAQNPILEEEVPEMARENKERKTRKHEEQILSSPSPSAAAILEQEAKLPKKRKRRKEQEPSSQSPLPFRPAQTHSLHLQGTTPPPEQPEAAHASKGKSTKTPSNTKKPRALSKREILRMRLEHLREQQTRFVATAMSEAHGLNSVSNCTEQNPNHSSPFGAFFDQFCYKPVRQDRNPSLPRTSDRPSRLPPQGYPAFESSQLTANETSKTSKAKTSLVSNTKLQGTGSGSQTKVNVKENKNPEKKMEETQMLSSSAPETPTLEQEAKATKKRMRTEEQEQSGPGQAHCVQLQGTTAPPEQEADVKKNNVKKPHVLSNRKIVKMRIEYLRKQQARFVTAAMSEGHGLNSVSNCTEQNPNHSSPFGVFFDQFCYKPISRDRNPLLPRTPDCLARLPPRGFPSFESSQLTANETSKTSKANTSVVSKRKQQRSGSGSQAKVNVREKKNSEMMKTRTKNQRKPKPLLTSAEKRSEKYRRLPLDQLVPPLRSPHKLLQEEYASDPWKVIVICMLLNLTQGKQRITKPESSNAFYNLHKEQLLFHDNLLLLVRKIVNKFFRLYPDAQTAFNADPKEMEGYLAPLGLQRVKTIRIQQFSREYVEKQWNYITELCGVGKYAADAYAIFCAGRATEVVPEDHKLVDYWKYVCFEMPQTERATNACNL